MSIQFKTVAEFREHNKELVAAIRQALKDKDYRLKEECSFQYRHWHIAYCMLRGTPYERIEAKVRDNHEPDWGIIDPMIAANQHLKHVPRIRAESADHPAEA